MSKCLGPFNKGEVADSDGLFFEVEAGPSTTGVIAVGVGADSEAILVTTLLLLKRGTRFPAMVEKGTFLGSSEERVVVNTSTKDEENESKVNK
ncbi:hypothetical protein LIER_30885 [Lithospermum erythrorhizon]|uniref:Uncharacterized protein n=1 Tax=Lithospermum erythrorhizon TaxID=34254 RepID=A0AAV3RSV1_LITER